MIRRHCSSLFAARSSSVCAVFSVAPPVAAAGARRFVASDTFTAPPLPGARETGIPAGMQPELAGARNPLAELLFSESSSTARSRARFATTLLHSASSTLPQSDELWQSPGKDALDMVADAASYYDILRYVKEHGHFFLIPKAVAAPDAPLPHVAYADIMLALTTCTMQRPPEEQFQLPAPVLRMLLCNAAYYILHDREYFVTVEHWFRQQVERQQSLGSEAWSAWIMCCAAANRVDLALLFLQHLAAQQQQQQQGGDGGGQSGFDPVVFSYMLHPSEMLETESGAPRSDFAGAVLGLSRNLLQQRRVLAEIQADCGVVAAGVHALFVFYALTQQPVQQWETIRVAYQEQQKQKQQEQSSSSTAATTPFVSARTLEMIKSVFRHEKGQRCGPLTCRVLVQLFAEQRDMLHTCMVLTALRQRELEERQQQPQPEQHQLVPVTFSKQEKRRVMRFFMDAEEPSSSQQPSLASPAREEGQVEEGKLHFPSLSRTTAKSGDEGNAAAQTGFREHLPLLDRLLNADQYTSDGRRLAPLPVPESISAALSTAPTMSSAAAPAVSSTTQIVNGKRMKLVRRRKASSSSSNTAARAPETGSRSSSLSEDEQQWRDLATPLQPGERVRTVVAVPSRSQLQQHILDKTARAFAASGGGGDATAAEAMIRIGAAAEREKMEQEQLEREMREGWFKM